MAHAPYDEFGAPCDWTLKHKIRNARLGIKHLQAKIRDCACGEQCLSCRERAAFIENYQRALRAYEER